VITFDLLSAEAANIDLANGPLAAGRIPQNPKSNFALLIWGVIIDNPSLNPLFVDALAVRPNLSAQAVYVAGWSRLVFEGIVQGQASFVPAMPVLIHTEPSKPQSISFLSDSSGSPVTFTQLWPDCPTAGTRDIAIQTYLEQPYGSLTLKFALRSARLEVNPADSCLLSTVRNAPKQYLPDFYRERELDAFGT
jgi:hypothetical protein